MCSSEPPIINEENFSSINYTYTTLYVPNGSLAAYQAADVWKYFMKIQEYAPTGIEDTVVDAEIDAENENAPIYNLQGVQMKGGKNLPAGIYIRGGKKFIVK